MTTPPLENPAPRFLSFAAAFEEAYGDDDWSRLEPFLTEDAVYEVTGGDPLGGRWEGRAAVLEQFQDICARFDKRFDSRQTEIVGAPEIQPGTMRFEWRATYTLAGNPDLVIGGVETAEFEGDRIRFLQDAGNEGDDVKMQTYLAAHLPHALP